VIEIARHHIGSENSVTAAHAFFSIAFDGRYANETPAPWVCAGMVHALDPAWAYIPP